MEPFKNKFSAQLIEQMGNTFNQIDAAFDKATFIRLATHDLEELELKQRSEQITSALLACLPHDFNAAVDLMLDALAPMKTPDEVDEDAGVGLHGWAIMPMCDVIAVNGLVEHDRFDRSIEALFQFTQRFSAEFAIRPFLDTATERTLNALKARLQDPSHHVRRLISEGTRPRLPWGMRLPVFIKQPELVLPLLTALRDDESEYVRRSVANNLNDIAKDHPDMVASLSVEWLKGASDNRKRLVKHACRTLLKQGHPTVLSAYGYHPAVLKSVSLTLHKDRIKIGEEIAFSLHLMSDGNSPQQLLVDYVVYHQKANATLQPKVFKWKTMTLAPFASVEATKTHSFKPVTTRKYYSGAHKIAILINGVEHAHTRFELVN